MPYPQQVTAALNEFDQMGEVMRPEERNRVIRLVIASVTFGADSKVDIAVQIR